MTSSAKKYLQEVNKHLKCSKKSKKKSIENLKHAIDDFSCAEQFTYDDLTERFGTPKMVANEYLSVMSGQELRHFTGKHKIILALSLGMTVIIIVFGIIYSMEIYGISELGCKSQ